MKQSIAHIALVAYENYKAKGVKFIRERKTEDCGTVAVFEDLYGNLWDLVEFSK